MRTWFVYLRLSEHVTRQTKKQYQQSLHSNLSEKEIQEITKDLNYNCSATEVTVLTGIANETLCYLKVFNSLCPSVSEVKYPRTPGYRPDPDDRVIAGNDDLDGRQKPGIVIPEYSQLLEPGSQHKRLGILQEGIDTCEPDTQRSIKDFLSHVVEFGFDVSTVSVTLHKHGLAIASGFIQQGANHGANSSFKMGTVAQFMPGLYPTSLEKAVRLGRRCSASLMSPFFKCRTAQGELMGRRYGNHYYCKSRNLVLELTRQYDDVLQTCDVIVMPTLTHVPSKFPVCQKTEKESLYEYLKVTSDQNANTVVTNMTGHPSLTLPLGQVGDGSKESLMIVGRKYDELTILQDRKRVGENHFREKNTVYIGGMKP